MIITIGPTARESNPGGPGEVGLSGSDSIEGRRRWAGQQAATPRRQDPTPGVTAGSGTDDDCAAQRTEVSEMAIPA